MWLVGCTSGLVLSQTRAKTVITNALVKFFSVGRRYHITTMNLSWDDFIAGYVGGTVRITCSQKKITHFHSLNMHFTSNSTHCNCLTRRTPLFTNFHKYFKARFITKQAMRPVDQSELKARNFNLQESQGCWLGTPWTQ